MNNFIKYLKLQDKHGGVPRDRVNISPINNAQVAAVAARPSTVNTTAINEQVQQLAQQLANEIIANQQQISVLARNGRVFTKFDQLNDVISNQTEVVTAGVWSDGIASLTTYATGSSQTTSQRRYYVDVYQKILQMKVLQRNFH